MTLSRTLKTVTAGALCTVAIAQAALAAGEQKNVRPFTRPLAESDALGRYLNQNRHAAMITTAGEPKNEPPFILADRSA